MRVAQALRNRDWRIDFGSIFQKGWLLRTFVVLACLGLGSLGGLAMPIFGTLSLISVVAVLGLIALPMVWLLTSNRQMDQVFILLVLVMLFQDIPLKLAGLSLAGGTQILLLILAPIGFPKYRQAIKQSSVLAAANILFACFILISLGSTFAGRSTALGAAYQFISNLKPFMFVALTYALAWQSSTEKIFLRILRIAWIPMVLMCIFEWAAPNLYSSIFSMGAAQPPGPMEGLPRATGVFSFPGTLAANASVLSVFFLLRAMYTAMAKRALDLQAAIGYASCIVFALSKGEMISFAACVFMTYVLYKKDGRAIRILAATAIIAFTIPVFYYFFGESIERELDAAGVTRAIGQIDHPRLQIFTYGFMLADQNWPLGVGLGTYAGAGAEKFDPSLYDMLGFRSYWWYGKEDFLMDTYWPNPIAETGYVGAGVLLLSYLTLFLYGIVKWLRSNADAAPYWGTAASGILFSIINSVSTPAFLESRTYFFVAIFFGLAYNTELRNKSALPSLESGSMTLASAHGS